MAKHVLIAYYSLTDQTRRAAEEMAKTFENEGWRSTVCRFDLAPEYAVHFPLRPFWRVVGKLVPPTLRAQARPVVFDEGTLDQRYDLVCIASPTWSNSPALPVSAFLQTPAAAKLLHGTPFAVLVVCRSLWRRNLAVVRKLATGNGGRYVGSEHVGFDGNQLQSTGSFFSYHRSGGEVRHRYLGIPITPYGLSDATMERVAAFARRLAGSV
jgi:hypothetical protein